MQARKPKSVYVTVKDGAKGKSKTVTLYDTTVNAVLKLLRQMAADKEAAS